MSAAARPRRTAWGISTPHVLATRAGAEVLATGGTAVDAAIAAGAVLTVVYPHNCSVGGDLIALVASDGSAPQAVFGVGRAASSLDVESLRRRFGETAPLTGPLSISVPGVISGWQAMHDLGGRRPFAELLRTAIGLAEEGVAIGRSLARALAELEGADPGLDALFGPRSHRLGEGDHVVQPELAATLRAIAADPQSYYRGELAQRLASSLASAGSPLRLADFERHEALVTPAIAARCGPVAPRLWTAGPPSQGVFLALLAHAAGLLRADGCALLGADADLLARGFLAASALRDELLADPRRANAALVELASKDAARRLGAELLGHRRATPPPGDDGATGPPRSSSRSAPSGDTAALVVRDDRGGAVSMLQSVFHSFGSGMLDPATGVVFHNRQAMFSLRAGAPNELGPGLMPPHTLSPALVSDEDGGLLAVLATMGGRAQPQILTEILLRLADGADPARAVGAPRFVVGELDARGANSVVLAEADLDRPALAALARSGIEVHALEPLDEAVGHAQLLVLHSGQALAGASDPRSDGAAICSAAN